jgi:hypothetical protein
VAGVKSGQAKNGSSIAVVSDGLDRAAFECFHAQADIFLGGRLLVDEGVAAFIVSGEKPGRSFAAKIAIDALLIDEEFAADVFRPFVCFVSHNQRVKESIAGECQAAIRTPCDISTTGGRFMADGLYSDEEGQ